MGILTIDSTSKIPALENNCHHMVQVTDEIDNVIRYYGSGKAAIRAFMRGNLDFVPAQEFDD